MPKITIVFLSAILAVGVAAPCYCQQDHEERRAVRVVYGTIYDLDWAASKMVVRWPDASGSAYREMVLDVPDNAVMIRGAEQIDFSELEINDAVTAKYYENPDGTGTLISLEDTTPSP
jgi:hypothetical protein